MIAYQAPEERLISLSQLRDYQASYYKIWLGGCRGRAQDWSEPRNWYPHGVPEWFDRVIIGGYSRHCCVIDKPVSDVGSVCILPNAKLHILEKGRLTIDGLKSDPAGLTGDAGLANQGFIKVRGFLSLRNARQGGILNRGIIINEGRIQSEGTIDSDDQAWGLVHDRGERVFLQN